MPSIRSFPIHFLLFFCSCTAAPPADDVVSLAAELEHELAARAQAASEACRTGDPWEPWAACLELSAPAVIAARHALAREEARARSLGAPVTMLEAESVGSGDERETELALALDLPGLLGAGRTAAMRARAEVDAAGAAASLAAASFGAQHELERALAQLAVARQLERDVAALEQACAPDVTRLELLAGRGWLPPDQVAAARTMLHHLAALGLEQRGLAAAARARAARVAGLAPSSPWLDDDEATALAVLADRTAGRIPPEDPGTRELLERLPALRLARLDYLAAEADVRIACAERWPALLIGPKATFTADDLLLGGILRLELPWPSAANAAVDAARSARAGARDALVAALAAAENDIAERREELRAAELALHEHGAGIARSSAEMLQAAQARFSVDAGALPEWTMALDQRTRAIAASSAALGRWLAVTFDLSEALGPPPDAAPSSLEGGT